MSPRELVDFYLDRIDRLNGELNAYWLLTPELALEQAAAAEGALAEDDTSGEPLHGIPVSVKDLH